MKFKNSSDISADGTHLQGYVHTTYDRLVEVFGQPTYTEPGDKTTAEWILQFGNGTVATIYDYKEYTTPAGMYNWHIGGHDARAPYYVNELI